MIEKSIVLRKGDCHSTLTPSQQLSKLTDQLFPLTSKDEGSRSFTSCLGKSVRVCT